MTEKGNSTLIEEPLRALLGAAEDPMRRLGKVLDTTTTDIKAARVIAAEAKDAVAPVASLFDAIVSARLGATPVPVVLDATGLQAAGSPEATAAAKAVDAFHFPVEFPEVFIRRRPGFDVMIGNPPWQEATIERHGFWALRFPGLRSLGQAEQEAKIDQLQRTRPDLVAEYERELADMESVRATLHAGPFPGSAHLDGVDLMTRNSTR